MNGGREREREADRLSIDHIQGLNRHYTEIIDNILDIAVIVKMSEFKLVSRSRSDSKGYYLSHLA